MEPQRLNQSYLNSNPIWLAESTKAGAGGQRQWHRESARVVPPLESVVREPERRAPRHGKGLMPMSKIGKPLMLARGVAGRGRHGTAWLRPAPSRFLRTF